MRSHKVENQQITLFYRRPPRLVDYAWRRDIAALNTATEVHLIYDRIDSHVYSV